MKRSTSWVWEVLKQFEKPFITAFGDSDPGSPIGKSDKIFHDWVPGAKGQNHKVFKDCAHFIQEDKGPEVARFLLEFIQNNPVK